MAYIKERGNNNYLVRVTYGKLENGRPFQKSRLFHPSRIDLPKTKLRKELDIFVKALEEECRREYETKYGSGINAEADELDTHDTTLPSNQLRLFKRIWLRSLLRVHRFSPISATFILRQKRRIFLPLHTCFMKRRSIAFSFRSSDICIWTRSNRSMCKSLSII